MPGIPFARTSRSGQKLKAKNHTQGLDEDLPPFQLHGRSVGWALFGFDFPEEMELLVLVSLNVFGLFARRIVPPGARLKQKPNPQGT